MSVFEALISRVTYPWLVYHNCICEENISKISFRTDTENASPIIKTSIYYLAHMFHVTFSASARMYPGEVMVTWNLGRTYFFTSNMVVWTSCGCDLLFSTLIFQVPCRRNEHSWHCRYHALHYMLSFKITLVLPDSVPEIKRILIAPFRFQYWRWPTAPLVPRMDFQSILLVSRKRGKRYY